MKLALRAIQVRLLVVIVAMLAFPISIISQAKRVKLSKPLNHRVHRVSGVRKDGKRYSHFAKCDCIFLSEKLSPVKGLSERGMRRVREIIG
mgnify:CR=1 FL=1